MSPVTALWLKVNIVIPKAMKDKQNIKQDQKQTQKKYEMTVHRKENLKTVHDR